MSPERLDRLLRIAVAFGVGLPAVPWILNFPHDSRYCTDVRLGEDVCGWASLLFLGVALFARMATFSWMTPSQQRGLVPRAILFGLLWFTLPLAASYGRFALER